ncbi:MAG: hypothetical protein KatS3mg076_3288 [Candidatus Binatia bacterium]|nr:MAG: hypothetical protein KatS3mg076_3288 [Candidatus Binatia bacterium]
MGGVGLPVCVGSVVRVGLAMDVGCVMDTDSLTRVGRIAHVAPIGAVVGVSSLGLTGRKTTRMRRGAFRAPEHELRAPGERQDQGEKTRELPVHELQYARFSSGMHAGVGPGPYSPRRSFTTASTILASHSGSSSPT